MAEIAKDLKAADALDSEALEAVLKSLGPSGDVESRLAAVVALLASGDAVGTGARGGAFADPPANLTGAFTTGLHNCLRGQPVNAVAEPMTKPSSRKQC